MLKDEIERKAKKNLSKEKKLKDGLKKKEKKSSTEWVNLVTFRSYSLPSMGLVLTRVRVVSL
jgi:hypothetical protein